MIFLLLACAEGTTSSPSLPELDRPASEAEWSAQEALAALDAALLDGFPEPAPVRDTYLELLSYGDAECPGHETYIDDTHLYGCDADSGYWFSGVSEYLLDILDGPKLNLEYWSVNGDMLFIDDSGDEFEGGGHVGGYWMELEGNRSGQFEFIGSWRWQGHDGWLGGDGVSAVLFYTLDPEVRTLELDGAVSWSRFSIYVDQLHLDASGVADGVLELRDPSGGWHRAELTSGCGVLRFEGGAGEEICPDLSPIVESLMSWMDEEAL